MHKITALLLTLLLLASCTPRSTPSVEPSAAPSVLESVGTITASPSPDLSALSSGWRTVAFEDMEYVRPDFDAIRKQMAEYTAAAASATDFAAIETASAAVDALDETINGSETLATLRHDIDKTDAFYDEEHKIMSEFAPEFGKLCTVFEETILDGAFADDYRAKKRMQPSERPVHITAAAEALQKERNKIVNDYLDKILFADEDDFEYEDYQKNAPEFSEMYIKLMEIDKQTAKELGFSSPVEMFYRQFDRDYTPEDALKFCETVKKTIAPLVDPSKSHEVNASIYPADVIAAMPDALAKIDPDLTAAWNFMQTYHLRELEPGRNRGYSGAFTAHIDQYDAPFLYAPCENTFDSMATLIHEFGHYYDDYLRGVGDSFSDNMDITEIYSQTLELLMMNQYGSFLSDADTARKVTLEWFIEYILVDQCICEEFQIRAYALENPNTKSLAKLYADIEREYGFYGDKATYSWYVVTHFFEDPFYTISYSVSAAAALQIWMIAEEDYAKGIETYLALLKDDQHQPFGTLLQRGGLRSVHDPAVLTDIAKNLKTSVKGK